VFQPEQLQQPVQLLEPVQLLQLLQLIQPLHTLVVWANGKKYFSVFYGRF